MLIMLALQADVDCLVIAWWVEHHAASDSNMPVDMLLADCY